MTIVDRGFSIGTIVRHFKQGRLYRIEGVALDSETGERMVAYRAMYHPFNLYVRPESSFCEELDPKKYPNPSQVHRMEVYHHPDLYDHSPFHANDVVMYKDSGDTVIVCGVSKDGTKFIPCGWPMVEISSDKVVLAEKRGLPQRETYKQHLRNNGFDDYIE